MSKINLYSDKDTTTTSVSNIFIDEYKLQIKPKEEFFVLIPPFYYLKN